MNISYVCNPCHDRCPHRYIGEQNPPDLEMQADAGLNRSNNCECPNAPCVQNRDEQTVAALNELVKAGRVQVRGTTTAHDKNWQRADFFNEYRLKPAEPPQAPNYEDEAKELIRRANDGLAAFKAIKTYHPIKFERACDDFTKPIAILALEDARLVFSPPKHTLALPDSGYECRYPVQGRVQIGCRDFDYLWLRVGLAGLCKQDVVQSDGLVPLVARRSGVQYSGNQITWKDADALLAWLEESK